MNQSAYSMAQALGSIRHRRSEGLPLHLTLLSNLQRWAERARQRRQLLSLESRMLKDIGITRADALREAAKPFWVE